MITIHIEYCGAWGYKPRSDKFQKLVRQTFPEDTITMTAGAGRTGSFEITLKKDGEDAQLIHSKIGGGGHLNDESTRKVFEAIGGAL